MTNFEKLGAVKQAASEKLFHIIIEAHEAGTSPYEMPAFAECVAIVQGVEIASTVAHKFDANPSAVSAGKVPESNDTSLQAGADRAVDSAPMRSSTAPGTGSSRKPNEEHLEGTSFQVNSNTLKEGDSIEG